MSAGQLLSALVERVEVRTTAFALPDLRVADLVDNPSALGPILKPTVVLVGPDGNEVMTFAPYGLAPKWQGVAMSFGALALLVVAGFALGRATA